MSENHSKKNHNLIGQEIANVSFVDKESLLKEMLGAKRILIIRFTGY